jgi:hypothetical protein
LTTGPPLLLQSRSRCCCCSEGLAIVDRQVDANSIDCASSEEFVFVSKSRSLVVYTGAAVTRRLIALLPAEQQVDHVSDIDHTWCTASGSLAIAAGVVTNRFKVGSPPISLCDLQCGEDCSQRHIPIAYTPPNVVPIGAPPIMRSTVVARPSKLFRPRSRHVESLCNCDWNARCAKSSCAKKSQKPSFAATEFRGVRMD